MDSCIACPWCGSLSTVSHGKAKSGRGRRLCRDCGRTFSETTGTVFLSRRMPEDKLRMMINLMLNDTKLKAITDCVGLSSKTTYLWRMKVFAAAYEIQKSAMLSGVVWIDEKSVPVNESMVVRLPSGKKMRGVSRNQACVACAVASNGARYAEVAGKGHITSAECVRTYGAHIAKGSKIVHDGVFSHDRLVAAVGGESEVWKSTAKEAHARLQPVNSFIAEIEHYLNVHTGIRTRYLGLYCAWIAFRASVKGKDIAERVDELVRECYQISADFKSRTRY